MSDKQASAAIVAVLQSRLDTLLQGDGGEAEIMEEITSLLNAAPDSAWDIAAVIQQRSRQGDITAELFHSLTSKIAGHQRSADDYGTTIGLNPPSSHPPMSDPAQYPSSPVGIGHVLRDRYVLEERLGRGGMGTVFKARDRYRAELPEPHQYVAIKILHGLSEQRPELLLKLKREFYSAQMLSHPNIVKVYELDQDGDVDFFTMEFLDGELLSSVIERFSSQPMSRSHAWAIIRDIGAGLAHAHARGVMHADLKPHNIMLTQSGEVRILDFGASSTQGHIAASTVTPAYACCELLAGRAPDQRDDIYALACVSYELLAGVHPFQRRSSIVARDLGIVAIRPAALKWPQWKALNMGLSWHRGARSVSVPVWLKRMNAERVAMSQLPHARDLKPAAAARPARPRKLSAAWPLRPAAILATLVIVGFVGVLSMVLRSGEKTGTSAIPVAAAARPLVSDPIVANDGEPARQQPTIAPLAPGVAVSGSSGSSGLAAASAAALAVPDYRIHLTNNFVEIRLHRSAPESGGNALVWWTEADSAKPGIDYMTQGKARRSFAKGETSASFFIKLVPKASRAHSEVFYLAVAEAGRGGSTGRIARTAIWLPATHDQTYTADAH
ncbi:MAG: serine/threonine-protein kinase [Gammaproteobacteria bacterium]